MTSQREKSAITAIEMDGEYPSDEALRVIREWPVTSMADCVALLDALRQVWRWPSYFEVLDNRANGDPNVRWSVSTGGWSGHEEMLDALEQNFMFWMLCWQSSERGGHFVFVTRE